MYKKEFVEEYCTNDVIQKFLKEQKINWDGKDINGNEYGAEGSSEKVWLVSEETAFPLPSEFKISPFNFTIMNLTYNHKKNVLYYYGVDFGSSWRNFMTKNNKGYLSFASENLDDLRAQLLKDYNERNKMLESLTSILKSFDKRISTVVTGEEWTRLNSSMNGIVNGINDGIEKKSAEISALEKFIVKVGGRRALPSQQKVDEAEREM